MDDVHVRPRRACSPWPEAGQRRDLPGRGSGASARSSGSTAAGRWRGAARRRRSTRRCWRCVRGLLPGARGVLEVRRADPAAGAPGLLVTGFLRACAATWCCPGPRRGRGAVAGEALGLGLVGLARALHCPAAVPFLVDAPLSIGADPATVRRRR